jgi:sugar lactone lactonase YvrE
VKSETPSIKKGTDLKWNQTGVVVAGTGLSGTGANQLNQPYCLYIDATDTMYICDSYNNRIQKWLSDASNGSTIAGASGGVSGSTSTLLNQPADIVFDNNGYMYVADTNNNRVKMFAPNSSIGVTVAGLTGNGGGLLNNQLGRPMGIAVDDSLNVYVTDTNNQRVMMWTPNATSGTPLISGTGQLNRPYGIVLKNGSSNEVYLGDNNRNQIQLWTFGAAQANTTLAGVNFNDLNRPRAIIFDPYGNLYVADADNNRVQMFCVGSTNGTTVAGSSGGTPVLNIPSGIAFDSDLNLYVSDTNNNQVLKYERL